MKQLEKLRIGLKNATGETGCVDFKKAFEAMNQVQIAEDPDKYESEMLKNLQAKKAREAAQQAEKQRQLDARSRLVEEVDKALFDFDEEIDNLETVAERYKEKEKKVAEVVSSYLVKKPSRPVGLSEAVRADIERTKAELAKETVEGAKIVPEYKPPPIYERPPMTSEMPSVDEIRRMRVKNVKREEKVQEGF